MRRMSIGLGIAILAVVSIAAVLVIDRPTRPMARPIAAPAPATPVSTEERPGVDFQLPTPWATNELVKLTVTTELDRFTLGDVELQPSAGIFVKTPIVAAATSASSVTFSVRVGNVADGSVTAVAHIGGTAGMSRSVRRTLYLATDSGVVLASTAGPTAAAEAVAARQRPEESSTRYVDQLDDLMFGGAVTPTDRVEPGRGQSLRVAGTAGYQASDGRPHPIRFAPVYLVSAGTGQALLIATTDAAGRFSAMASDAARGLCGACRLRVAASFRGLSVTDETAGGVYGIESASAMLTGDIGWRVSLLANNVSDNNTAFSVRDALVTSDLALSGLVPGASASLKVAYPTARMTSSFNPGGDHTLHVLRSDRFDWDVIGHEFAHYVEDRFGLTGGQEGPHTIGLGSASKRGKAAGEELAWSEGFATWLSIAAQREQQAAELHIPYVGDDDYTDTEDVVPAVSYSLAAPTDPPGQGPDDELSVQRVLFGLAFGDPTAGWPALGENRVMDVIVNAKITSLAQLLRVLPPANPATGSATSQTAAFHECLPTSPDVSSVGSGNCRSAAALLCVLAHNQSGVTDVERSDSAARSSISWRVAAAPAEVLSAFRIVVFDHAWRPVEESPRLSVPHWQPAPTLDPGSHVVVLAWQTDAPSTGPYGSCALGFR